MNTTDPSQPKLAPPGAGLPWYIELILRIYLMPFVVSKVTWEESEKRFHKTHQLILQEIDSLSVELLEKKILVPPQIGLEDSSRYWSIIMTLEHIMIVGGQIFGVILALTNGKIPDGKADISTYKPKGQTQATEIQDNFKKYISVEFDKLNSEIGNRSSNLKFNHPWFGKMKAQHWYWLLSAHANIHLKQIREIKRRLDQTG